MKGTLAVAAFLLTLAGPAVGNDLSITPEKLAEAAISDNAATAAAARAALRSDGPKGLETLLKAYAPQIAEYEKTGENTPEWLRIEAALDEVAMQKDAYSSGLYWYTDLEAAKKAANSKNRPILSLRLLGNLNEEFSCANSRLFRSILYANAEISNFLRENYILHWRSVRPAPRITIDFGDGRRIERTITGNSIHYILDEDGFLIDALPGLYSPSAFLTYIQQAEKANSAVDGMPVDRRHIALMRYRKASFDTIRLRRDNAIKLSNIKVYEPPVKTDAVTAGFVAATKMVVVSEISMLRLYDDFAKYVPQLELEEWQRLAETYAGHVFLDQKSLSFIRRQTGMRFGEEKHTAMLKRLENVIALDTTRNEFLYRLKIYELMNSQNFGIDRRNSEEELERFNSLVYADVFLTPDSDPWLGLYNSDLYAAIEGNGVRH